MSFLSRQSREAELSPDGRYVRFDIKLGNGAYKDVFLCYDTETGKEVAWNTVSLGRLPPNEQKRIRMETEILSDLNHPHIINFYNVWESPEKDQICFTTEIVTSGTLKQYVNRVKAVKLKIIKRWCREILNALDYMHRHSPPIIHRDLKCDNIFINGSTGEIRLGDFGLSAARHTTHVESVLGTPQFMSPELYAESYTESVDIYAFGMCILEMVTKEYPYEECSNPAQIWRRVSSGQKPAVLYRIRDAQVRSFVELCLSSAELRLSAKELLKHPFLAFKTSHPLRDDIVVQVDPKPQSHLDTIQEKHNEERSMIHDKHHDKSNQSQHHHTNTTTTTTTTTTTNATSYSQQAPYPSDNMHSNSHLYNPSLTSASSQMQFNQGAPASQSHRSNMNQHSNNNSSHVHHHHGHTGHGHSHTSHPPTSNHSHHPPHPHGHHGHHSNTHHPHGHHGHHHGHHNNNNNGAHNNNGNAHPSYSSRTLPQPSTSSHPHGPTGSAAAAHNRTQSVTGHESRPSMSRSNSLTALQAAAMQPQQPSQFRDGSHDSHDPTMSHSMHPSPTRSPSPKPTILNGSPPNQLTSISSIHDLHALHPTQPPPISTYNYSHNAPHDAGTPSNAIKNRTVSTNNLASMANPSNVSAAAAAAGGGAGGLSRSSSHRNLASQTSAPPAATNSAPSGSPNPTTPAPGNPAAATTTPAPPPVLQSVAVDVDHVNGRLASIALHLQFEGAKKKKQIKFNFNFDTDTSISVAGELAKALKLTNRTARMTIASAMESKIDEHRKHYFEHILDSEANATDDAVSTNTRAPSITNQVNPTITANHPPTVPSTATSSPVPLSLDRSFSAGITQTSQSRPSTASALPNTNTPTAASSNRSPTPPSNVNVNDIYAIQRSQSTTTPSSNHNLPPTIVSTTATPSTAAPPPLRRSASAAGPGSQPSMVSGIPSPIPEGSSHSPSHAQSPVTSAPMSRSNSRATLPLPSPNSHNSFSFVSANASTNPEADPLAPLAIPISPRHTFPGTLPVIPTTAPISTNTNSVASSSTLPQPSSPVAPTAESLREEYKSLNISSLKTKIKELGGASQLKGCLEKTDIIEMLINLTLSNNTFSSPSSALNSTTTSSTNSTPSTSSVSSPTAPVPSTLGDNSASIHLIHLSQSLQNTRFTASISARSSVDLSTPTFSVPLSSSGPSSMTTSPTHNTRNLTNDVDVVPEEEEQEPSFEDHWSIQGSPIEGSSPEAGNTNRRKGRVDISERRKAGTEQFTLSSIPVTTAASISGTLPNQKTPHYHTLPLPSNTTSSPVESLAPSLAHSQSNSLHENRVDNQFSQNSTHNRSHTIAGSPDELKKLDAFFHISSTSSSLSSSPSLATSQLQGKSSSSSNLSSSRSSSLAPSLSTLNVNTLPSISPSPSPIAANSASSSSNNGNNTSAAQAQAKLQRRKQEAAQAEDKILGGFSFSATSDQTHSQESPTHGQHHHD